MLTGGTSKARVRPSETNKEVSAQIRTSLFKKTLKKCIDIYDAILYNIIIKGKPRRKNRGHGYKAQAIELKSTDRAKAVRND